MGRLRWQTRHRKIMDQPPNFPANKMSIPKETTICVLCYGDFPDLARRCIGSIIASCPAEKYELRVGLNECSPATIDYVQSVPEVDSIYLCRRNLNQCPMMARMLSRLDTEFVWWFDDDSHVTHPGALDYRLRVARECQATVGLWGEVYFNRTIAEFADEEELQSWLRRQSWYRGQPAPCGRCKFEPGYRESGDQTWHFCAGGSWFARSRAIEELGWPPKSLVKRSNDVLLGEAMRQAGYEIMHIGGVGVAQSDAPRRGTGESLADMTAQMRA